MRSRGLTLDRTQSPRPDSNVKFNEPGSLKALPNVPRRAIAHLAAADPKLADVIRRVGPWRLRRTTEGTHFDAVCRSIIYQQLSGRAAATIHARVLGLYEIGRASCRERV